MKGIEIHHIAALVRNDDRSLDDEDEVRVRHRILVAAGSDDGKGFEVPFHPLANMGNVHSRIMSAAAPSVNRGPRGG